MANRKQVQKKITHKGGAINSVEQAVERMNAHKVLEYAKKLNKPVKYLLKDTHTGITTIKVIQPI